MRIPIIPLSLRTPIFYPLIAVVAAAPLARGDYNAAYTSVGEYKSEGTKPKSYHREWMKWLPDSMRISELSIPGTHDAGTESFHALPPLESALSDCQDAYIPQQLEAGVRFLDLRVTVANGQWKIHHNFWTYRLLADVLKDIRTFLQTYPSETVLVRISVYDAFLGAFLESGWPAIEQVHKGWIWPRERDDDGNVLYRADGVTPQTYAHLATGNEFNDVAYDKSSFTWPTLGEVRGKMVMFLGKANPLLYEKKGHTSGLGYQGYNKNELFSTRTYNGKIVMTCRDQFETRSTGVFGEKQFGDLTHITLASETRSKDHLFVTGLNIGAAPNPNESAPVMNRWLLNSLNDPAGIDWKKTGIVLLDFPGPALLDSIISLNFRHATSLDSPFPADFKEFAARVAWDKSLVDPSQNNPEVLAANYRKLLKERIPFCEFNTFVTSLPHGEIVKYESTIDTTDTNGLSLSAGPLGDLAQTVSVFPSYRETLTLTSDQLQGALDGLLARTDPAATLGNKATPQWIKDELGKIFSPLGLDFVVYVHQASDGAAVYAGFDFEPNVACAQAWYSLGSLVTYWLVAASAPKPVSTGVSYPAVVGQWDFNKEDLTATVGEDLVGDVSFLPAGFSRSASMYIDNANGVRMTHAAAPNGGPSAARLNEWTLIMDLYLGTSTSRRSLIQIDTLDNTTDGDLFISPEGGIGIDDVYHGKLELFKWYRVAIAVDATREQVISKYIDGELIGEQSIRPFDATPTDTAGDVSYSYSSRWSLKDEALLFGDSAGQAQALLVDNIQLRNYKMCAAEVKALGGPSQAGFPIPNDAMSLSVEMVDGLRLHTDNNGFQRMDTGGKHWKVSWNSRYQLQHADFVGSWKDVDKEDRRFYKPEGTHRQSILFNPETRSRQFFRGIVP